MRDQSEACGTEIISQTVAKVDLKARPFKYWLHPMGDDDEIEEEEHTADSLIIATGAKARRLDLPGEEKYWGNGVSACAVCDGSLPMFRDQSLVVIGGGDSAVEEALYLTKKAKKVTVLVRRDKLRASRTNARRLTTHPKVEVLFNSSASEIKGEDKKNGLMTHLVVKDNVTKEEKTIEAKGLFYAVGHDPATQLFQGQLDMDEDGYLVTKPGEGITSVEGVFAAGDVQDKRYRQAVTSAGMWSFLPCYVRALLTILQAPVALRPLKPKSGLPNKTAVSRTNLRRKTKPKNRRRTALYPSTAPTHSCSPFSHLSSIHHFQT